MTKVMLQEQKNRKLFHIELLRVIACFFVVFNHTEHHGYYLFSTYPDNSGSVFGSMSIKEDCVTFNGL